MVDVKVCIGSSCYVKGSDQIVENLQKLIKQKGWDDKVNIKGSFCMQNCQNKQGIGITINNEKIEGITLANAMEILQEIIEKLI